MDRPDRDTFSFQLNWSRRSVTAVSVVIGAWLVRLVVGEPFDELLALRPLGHGFQPWQPLTFVLVQDPVFVAMSSITLGSLLEPTIEALGNRRFWWSSLILWASTTLGILLLGLTPWLGATPIQSCAFWLEALVVWFAFAHRGATLRFMGAIPLQAVHLAWVSLAFGVISLLWTQTLFAAHLLLAWAAAAAIFHLDDGVRRRWNLQQKRRKIEKAHTRLQVLEGGKSERPRRGKPDDYVN